MRRTVAITSAVAAAAATAVTITAAQASPEVRHGGSGTDSHKSRNITVVERAVSDTVIDTGRPATAKATCSRLRTRSTTGPTLTRSGVTTAPASALSSAECGSARGRRPSEADRWSVAGPFYDKHDSVLAITGGTGVYSRARGEMHLHARNAQGTAYTFAFKVEY